MKFTMNAGNVNNAVILTAVKSFLSRFESERQRKEREEIEYLERWQRLIALDKQHKESIKLARHIQRQDLDKLK